MIFELLLVAVSITFLYVGADKLVSGASSLGIKVGIAPLVVGLTIVAFGTSFPELLVSVQSAFSGLNGIAVGNVVGSNIFNIACILGITACICPPKVELALIRRDVPIMILVAILGALFIMNGFVSRLEGLMLFTGIVAYTIATVKANKDVLDQGLVQEPPSDVSWLSIFGILSLGLVVLVIGSTMLVENASAIAKSLGVSDAIIGLTIVAAGTSMPELATSVVAAIKGKPDLAIGNVVGSNIFNILCILGISATILPLDTTSLRSIDLCAMLVCSILVLPFLYTGKKLTRREGVILLFLYGLYLLLVWY
jgi:cation:H+ antiporter